MSDFDSKFDHRSTDKTDTVAKARLSHLEMRRGFWLVDVRKAVIKSMSGVERWECPAGEKPKEAMWRMMGVERE